MTILERKPLQTFPVHNGPTPFCSRLKKYLRAILMHLTLLTMHARRPDVLQHLLIFAQTKVIYFRLELTIVVQSKNQKRILHCLVDLRDTKFAKSKTYLQFTCRDRNESIMLQLNRWNDYVPFHTIKGIVVELKQR